MIIVEFLSVLFRGGPGYHAVNSARCALHTVFSKKLESP